MINLAYDPASGKLGTEAVDQSREISKAMAGIARSVISSNLDGIRYLDDRINQMKRDLDSDIERKASVEKDLEKLRAESGSITSIVKKTKSQIKESDIFNSGMIASITFQENKLIVITEKLKFYKGTPLSGRMIEEDIDLGRYLIVIDPSNSGLSQVTGITSLDYGYDYSSPTITLTSICWGSSADECHKIASSHNIVNLIDFVVGYILSVNDEEGYTRWTSYLRERKSIATNPMPGRPLAITQSREIFLPIPTPLKLKNYKEVLKIVSLNDIDTMIGNGRMFIRIREYSGAYPDYYISRASLIAIFNNQMALGGFDRYSSNPLPIELVPTASKLMKLADEQAGYTTK